MTKDTKSDEDDNVVLSSNFTHLKFMLMLHHLKLLVFTNKLKKYNSLNSDDDETPAQVVVPTSEQPKSDKVLTTNTNLEELDELSEYKND